MMEIFLGIYVLLRISIAVAYNAITGLFTLPRGVGYGQNLLYTVVRAGQHFDPARKLRATRSTVEAYMNFVNRQPGVAPRTTILTHEAKLLWLGDTKPQKMVYYLHGGGYIEPPVRGHFVVLQRLIDRAQEQGITLGVAVLAYDLAPGGQYPRQLEQASIGLRYLMGDLGIQASDISISGDSAGGNLALALMAHIMHPHPSVERVTLNSPKLAGFFPISPWVTASLTAASITSNADKDYLEIASLKVASAEYLGRSGPDNYNFPLAADAAWWQDLPARSIGVLAGSLEIFRDDIRTLVDKMKTNNPTLRYIEVPDEVHVHMAFNATIGAKVAVSEDVLFGWVIDAAQT